MRIIFLAVVFFNISIQAMIEISISHNDIDRSYLQYMPPNKNINDPIDLFYWFAWLFWNCIWF